MMRKVSFSAIVNDPTADNLAGDAPVLSTIEQDIADDEPLHPIEVRPFDRLTSDADSVPADLVKDAEVFEVKLGMLKQGTIYVVEFVLPSNLPPVGNFELIRSMIDVMGKTTMPVNVGANLRLISCTPNPNKGYLLTLEVATTKSPRINEWYILRHANSVTDVTYFIAHGLSLAKPNVGSYLVGRWCDLNKCLAGPGRALYCSDTPAHINEARGQGTPFLRTGIHRLRDNEEVIDSDECTEWPGHKCNEDEDDEKIPTICVTTEIKHVDNA